MHIIVGETHRDGIVKPLPYYLVKGCNENGEKIGWADFMVPPTIDKIYINKIEVASAFQRKGYGLQLLLEISNWVLSEYGKRLPITPIREFYDSQSFWDKLRAGAVPELVVTRDVKNYYELLDEAKRWGYKSIFGD